MRKLAVAVVAFSVAMAFGFVWANGDSQSRSGVTPPARPPIATPPSAPRADITGWNTDLDYALSRAGRVGRPVLVFFTASWAPPCQAMKREVLTQSDVEEALRAVEPVEIDVDAYPTLAGKFKVDRLPVFAVLNTDGREYDRFSGFLPDYAFIETLRAAIDPNQAPALLEEHVRRHERDLQARWLLARKYARDRNQRGLERVLDEMRSLDSRGRKGYLDNVAYLEFMTTLDMDKPADGYRAAALFLREFPRSEFADEVEFARAQLAWQMGDTDEALRILRAFTKQYPRSRLGRQVERDLRRIERAARR